MQNNFFCNNKLATNVCKKRDGQKVKSKKMRPKESNPQLSILNTSAQAPNTTQLTIKKTHIVWQRPELIAFLFNSPLAICNNYVDLICCTQTNRYKTPISFDMIENIVSPLSFIDMCLYRCFSSK